jgi:outer membrane protein OmpA-like peptidoglycan-associated protein
MRKLLISTTALSVAISPMGTLPAYAQVLNADGSITGPDGSVICAPTADVACDFDAVVLQLQAEAEAAAAEAAALEAAAAEAAAAEAAARAEAEAAAQAEVEARAAAEAAAQAQAEAEAQAAADAAAEAAAQAAAEAEAAAQAEAEAAAQAQAEADAAAEAQAEAEAAAAAAVAAAEQQASDEAAAAEEAAIADGLAAEEAARAEAEAAAQAEADALAEAEAQAAAEAAAEAEAELQAAEEPATEEPVAEAPAEEPAAEEPVAEAPATEEPAAEVEARVEAEVGAEVEAEVSVGESLVVDPVDVPEGSIIDSATGELIDAETAQQALQAAQQELGLTATGEMTDPTAGLRVAAPATEEESTPVDTPEVSETEVETLTELLTTAPTSIDPSALAAAALVTRSTAEAEATGGPATFAPAAQDLLAAITETTLTEGSVRSSAQEFSAAPVTLSAGKKSGLSDLEKAGLLVLGALAVGAIIKNNREAAAYQEPARVVSNTGDRVIVLQPDGTYRVLKDDDTVIRRPGSTVRTETFKDGSTRTIVERADGTQVVTIRDATGRVLRRATYDSLGREVILIDDLAREEVVVVRDLPRPERRIVISSADSDVALKRELAAVQAERAGRKFSLRQIREIPEVRALAAVIDARNVTFATNSSAIAPEQARNLADLGRVMKDLLRNNPREMFLIEGHTDATGPAALNLALSDRRAESVALALTEYFDIPPENMVIQGYGETELLIDTQASEPRNRRVEVRVITPLLRTATR